MLTVQGTLVAHRVPGAETLDVTAKGKLHPTSMWKDSQSPDNAQTVVALRDNLLLQRSNGCPGAPGLACLRLARIA